MEILDSCDTRKYLKLPSKLQWYAIMSVLKEKFLIKCHKRSLLWSIPRKDRRLERAVTKGFPLKNHCLQWDWRFNFPKWNKNRKRIPQKLNKRKRKRTCAVTWTNTFSKLILMITQNNFISHHPSLFIINSEQVLACWKDEKRNP